MICHYEVFSLEFSATADDIKKRYRKLALQFHPGESIETAIQLNRLRAGSLFLYSFERLYILIPS
jgi:hypothetical protein